MDITPAVPDGRQLVDSYGPGRFKIRGQSYEGPVIVFPNRVLSWDVAHIDELTLDAVAAIRDADPSIEILLLGTGERMAMPPGGLRREMREKGIGVDLMDTGAACRTFNILMTEGRLAAAALIPV
ncbi:hypothetical protein HH303_17015 [Rhodospirillaceae bacterium KN72]|uniref:Xcc1710-like domain-containing protein n=1 Tax=Pacificispira spongiicola TaxID=2729598 RepID=A0A7Y0E2T6_9PROT|nr:Mth938-like domain-containing protein [Pacificispira spongiicola]NMM46195.1 hypothetical protein [Pacificispira spongiicola]